MKIYFFEVNTKNIPCLILKISAVSFVLRTRDIADIFNAVDESSQNSKYLLCFVFLCPLGCDFMTAHDILILRAILC